MASCTHACYNIARQKLSKHWINGNIAILPYWWDFCHISPFFQKKAIAIMILGGVGRIIKHKKTFKKFLWITN